MTEPSVIGNVADLEQGQVLLPGFVTRQEDGLYIDLLAIDSNALMQQFVERVFSAGARFADLDYELFLNLLFLWQPADIDRKLDELKRRGKPPSLRLAADIVPFPAARRAAYRGVKFLDGGNAAEYIFEQISVERVIDDPEAPDGSGKRTVADRLYPDFDEFIADLWEKGLRFGIDAKAVREAIARDKAERVTIARMTPPTEGRDAGIDEQTDLLHRDDAPRLLPNGKMDLHHYRNRFPQVSAGTRLFKKIPRVPGISGWDVQGKELSPGEIKDFDIETLAGPGTEVVREAGGEFVVAAMDGFLDIDAQSGQISVVDKIISREGVSMRTTGDLSLSGDEYEEHGEVQEKRVVEGHNMTFLADVFGRIVSDGGRVTLKRNISGGAVQDAGGEVFIEGGASSATLDARRGSVTANHAENCIVIAERVSIGRAIRCAIIADVVEIQLSEGSVIAAKKIAIEKATVRRDDGTAVTVLLPDLEPFLRGLRAIDTARAEAEAQIAKINEGIAAIVAEPEMKSYMTIQARLKAKTLVMNDAQKVQWQGLLTRIAPNLRRIAALNKQVGDLRQAIADGEAEREKIRRERQEASLDISCTIKTVAGDTRVRCLRVSADGPPLANLPAKELHMKLREPGAETNRLFAGHGGSFEWAAPVEGVEEPPEDSGQD